MIKQIVVFVSTLFVMWRPVAAQSMLLGQGVS